MKYFSVLILLAFIFISCGSNNTAETALLSGRFEGVGGQTIVLEELKTSRLIPVDSVQISSGGQFQIKVLPSEKSFYLLHVGGYPVFSVVLDKHDSLFIVADTAKISRTYNISGNQESEVLKQHFEQKALTKSVIDSLRQVLFENQPKNSFAGIKKSIDSTLEATFTKFKNNTKELILQNPGNIANLLLLNSNLAGRQIFNIDVDAVLYTQIETNLLAKYPENSHVKMHTGRMQAWRNQRAEKNKAEERLEVGKPVPQIKLPDIEGKTQALSDLAGNEVILFFWASWSPESRADIQLLKSKYPEFKRDGLKIYAVSLDHKAQFWEAAIKTENLKWVNVSDLAGPESPVAELFNLNGKLPLYFLIDRQGHIRAKTSNFSQLIDSVDTLMHKSQL